MSTIAPLDLLVRRVAGDLDGILSGYSPSHKVNIIDPHNSCKIYTLELIFGPDKLQIDLQPTYEKHPVSPHSERQTLRVTSLRPRLGRVKQGDSDSIKRAYVAIKNYIADIKDGCGKITEASWRGYWIPFLLKDLAAQQGWPAGQLKFSESRIKQGHRYTCKYRDGIIVADDWQGVTSLNVDGPLLDDVLQPHRRRLGPIGLQARLD